MEMKGYLSEMDKQTPYTLLTGKRAMTISGATIPGTMPVSMTITADAQSRTPMTLTGAASTASSRHTVCTALRATTADAAASAPGHNR